MGVNINWSNMKNRSTPRLMLWLQIVIEREKQVHRMNGKHKVKLHAIALLIWPTALPNMSNSNWLPWASGSAARNAAIYCWRNWRPDPRCCMHCIRSPYRCYWNLSVNFECSFFFLLIVLGLELKAVGQWSRLFAVKWISTEPATYESATLPLDLHATHLTVTIKPLLQLR